MRMAGVTFTAAASPTRTPRGSGRSSVMSATTMRARMMLTCPSRKFWRTGSNSTTGSTSANAHHRTVRRSNAAHTARRLTAIEPEERSQVQPGERHVADARGDVREGSEEQGGEGWVGEPQVVGRVGHGEEVVRPGVRAAEQIGAEIELGVRQGENGHTHDGDRARDRGPRPPAGGRDRAQAQGQGVARHGDGSVPGPARHRAAWRPDRARTGPGPATTMLWTRHPLRRGGPCRASDAPAPAPAP